MSKDEMLSLGQSEVIAALDNIFLAMKPVRKLEKIIHDSLPEERRRRIIWNGSDVSPSWGI